MAGDLVLIDLKDFAILATRFLYGPAHTVKSKDEIPWYLAQTDRSARG